MSPPTSIATVAPPVWAGCAAVAVGAVAGSALRWGTGAAIDAQPGEFPTATLLVNLLGCLLVGVAARRVRPGSLAWLGLVTGGLGGLTTFSAFAVETRALLAGGRGWAAATYVVASVAGGVGAAALARRGVR